MLHLLIASKALSSTWISSVSLEPLAAEFGLLGSLLYNIGYHHVNVGPVVTRVSPMIGFSQNLEQLNMERILVAQALLVEMISGLHGALSEGC